MADTAVPTTLTLDARRQAAAARLHSVDLPAHRGVAGWEFTPVDRLDLDAFPPAPGGSGAEHVRARRTR